MRGRKHRQRSAARLFEAWAPPCPFFRIPRRGKWSAGRRQGAALRRPSGARCVTPDTERALQGRGCESRPEARACGDLEACEASPPKRCASRRSTPQASRLRKDNGPRCRRPDPGPLAERVMTAPLGEQGCDQCKCGFDSVRNFF